MATNPAPQSMSSALFGNSSASDSLLEYRIDSLFRSNQPLTDIPGKDHSAVRLEVSRIFINGLRANNLPSEDRQYLAQVIAKRTGLSTADAEKRVSDIFNKAHAEIISTEQNAKQAADNAPKTAAYSALWMCL